MTSILPLLPTRLAAIGEGFWASEVIGDFQEGDARKFLEVTSGVTVDDSVWAKVYEVGSVLQFLVVGHPKIVGGSSSFQ